VETAIAKRKCHANKKHSIAPGEKHFAYDYGPLGRQNICKECASPILDIVEEQIRKVRKELES